MASLKLLSFEEAIAECDGPKHLLTGNGFSMAYDHTRFSYTALFQLAETKLPTEVRRVFKSVGTSDFEIVMRLFRDSARLVKAYAAGRYPKLAKRLEKEASGIRDALATAIAASHPDRPSDIPDSAYAACRSFLAHFKCVYTLNYDLLLYWAMMHDNIGIPLSHDDGFRTPEDGPASYVSWEVEKTDKQNIHYLHGSLHVFDAEHEIQKYTWCNTGIALIDQIREALDDEKFPIFVAEGQSKEKLTRIQHSNFLGRSYRSFAKSGGALFVYGHSLAENDDHILRHIPNGIRRKVYISLFGDPSSKDNKRIMERALKMKTTGHKPPEVRFYDAASAKVWGK